MRLIACLIARDEEANLPRCLSSLAGVVDGICLLDTGSADRTLEIARSFGARTASLPWDDDFSVSRNACLDLAEGDWILQVHRTSLDVRGDLVEHVESLLDPGHFELALRFGADS